MFALEIIRRLAYDYLKVVFCQLIMQVQHQLDRAAFYMVYIFLTNVSFILDGQVAPLSFYPSHPTLKHLVDMLFLQDFIWVKINVNFVKTSTHRVVLLKFVDCVVRDTGSSLRTLTRILKKLTRRIYIPVEYLFPFQC